MRHMKNFAGCEHISDNYTHTIIAKKSDERHTVTPKQAVKRFLDQELLLQIKHGGEDASDVRPGGWFDEWHDALTELTRVLDHADFTEEEQTKIAQALKIDHWWGPHHWPSPDDPNYDPMDEDPDFYRTR